MLSGQLELLYAPQRLSWALGRYRQQLKLLLGRMRGCKGCKDLGQHQLEASVYLHTSVSRSFDFLRYFAAHLGFSRLKPIA